MAIMDREFMEQTRADYVADLFPYLKDRFDALHEIREWHRDMSRTTSMTRQFAKNGVLGRPLASIPWQIMYFWKKTYGFHMTQNRAMFRAWLAQNPEYKLS